MTSPRSDLTASVYCPCGYQMPSPAAARACEAECDDEDRETRLAARAASRRLATWHGQDDCGDYDRDRP